MSIQKATLNDLDSLSKLFDLYRIFYQQKSDLSGAREFIRERLNNKESVFLSPFMKINLLALFNYILPFHLLV